MSFTFFLNSIGYAAVALMALFACYKLSIKGKVKRKIGYSFAFLGVFYAIASTLELSWVFNLLPRQVSDTILLVAVILFLTATLLLYVVYEMTGTQTLLYLYLLFILTLVTANYTLYSFFLVSMLLSILLLVFVFLEFVLSPNFYIKSAGLLGTVSVVFFFVIIMLSRFGKPLSELPFFIPVAVLCLCFHYFTKGMKESVVSPEHHIFHHYPAFHLTVLLLKFLIFIFSISAFTLVSVVAVHEFGHAIVGQLYGCEVSRAILYDVIVGAPHTELVCKTTINETLITLGGLLTTLIVALLFYSIGERLMRKLAVLITGYSFLITYGDFLALGLSPSAATATTLFALFIVALSVVNLSLYYFTLPTVSHHIWKDIAKIRNQEETLPSEEKIQKVRIKHLNPVKIKLKQEET